MIRRFFLLAAALSLASIAHAQTIPCPQQPATAFVKLTDTTYVVTRAVALRPNGSCVGIVTYVKTLANLLRYEVQYVPCLAGDPWRLGAQYTTLTTATRAAGMPPTCGSAPPPQSVDTLPSAATSTVELWRNDFSATTDSVLVGDTVRLIVTAKTQAGATLGNGKTVTVDVVSGTTGTPSYFDGTSNRYFTALIGASSVATQTVRVRVNGVLLNASVALRVVSRPVVVVPPPPADTTFTACVNVGARCVFVGVRDVRLVNATGSYFITKESSGGLDCGLYAFTATVAWNPPGGGNTVATSCRVGALKRVLVSNPFSGMAGTHANFLVQKGDTGVANAQPGTDSFSAGSTPGEGSSRFTCYIAKFGTFDPLVYPGQSNVGHFHMFYGNAGISPSSTSATLVASGNSTCDGGTLNRTAYWVPALFAYNAANTVDTVPALAWGQVYYKTGYNVNTALTQPFPAGLHMIAGDKSATGSQDINGAQGVSWICRDGSAPNSTDGTIPNCGVNDEVQSWIKFPHCWDGVNLDSPDHKSHMAYPNFRNLWDPSPSRSYCPSTHSVQLPQVTQILRFPVTVANDPLRWRLTCDMNLSSRGGLCAHADWMMAWDVPTMQKLVTNCLQAQKDCQVGYVGSGLPLLYQKP